MTEYSTEQAGFTEPAPAGQPAAGGYQFTPEQLAAAREQLQAAGELDPATAPVPVAEDSAALGMRALADGATPAEVDTGALLRQIQAMQQRMDALEREKKLSAAPEVVKYATALHDHLTAKALAHPVINLDPDHGWGQALEQTAAVKETAAEAAATGHPGTLEKDVQAVAAWVSRHARRFPQIDYSYVLDLAEETIGAIAKLAA